MTKQILVTVNDDDFWLALNHLAAGHYHAQHKDEFLYEVITKEEEQ